MADTVTIAGHKEKKWVVYAAGVGGAIAIYFVWKQHQASAAAAAASSSSSGMVTDPTTGVQYPADGTDPVTGETYSQEIGQYGSVEAADEAVSTEDSSYLGDSGNLYGTGYDASDYSTGTYGATTTVSGSIYTSNSAWTQAATAGLQDIGYTGTEVSAALGAYLDGQPLTTDQVAIVQSAIAEYGPPPIGTYTIIQGGSGNTSSATTVAVPNVVGYSLSDAQSAIQGAGLVYNGPSTGSTVATESPSAGTQVQPGSTVTVTANAATTTTSSSGSGSGGWSSSSGSGSSSTGSTSTGSSSSSAPPPTTTTSAAPPPAATPTISGGHVVSVANNTAVVAWTGSGASSYEVQITGPGAINGQTATVGIAQATYGGLEAGHTYDVNVTPISSSGQRGVSGTITFVTTDTK